MDEHDADGARTPEPVADSADTPPDGAAKRSLAQKVDHLFATVHPARGEYTYEQVATEIREGGGPTISAAYVWMLRKGQRDNPTMKHLEALAGFFGVPAAYFFDDDLAARVDEQLAVVTALRDAPIRRIALRASGLSSQSLTSIANMIEHVRTLEGLPPESAETTSSGDSTPQA